MFLTVSISVLAIYVVLAFKKPGVAIITCPFVAGLVGFAGSLQAEPALSLLGVALFLLTVVGVAASKRRPDAEEWPQTLARWILIGVAVVLTFVVLLVTAASSVLGMFLSIAFALFIVVSIGATVFAAITSRRATAGYVLTTIGGAIRQNLPLPMALQTAAGDRSDRRSRILRRLQQWLVQGYPLSQAIRYAYPGCPSHAVANVVAAERTGQMCQAFECIVADLMETANRKRRFNPVHVWYPILLFTVITLVVIGLGTFVLPQLKAVWGDLSGGDLALPAPTKLLFDIAGWFYNGPGTLLLSVILLALFTTAALWIHTRLRPRRPGAPHLLSRMGDFIKWHMPVSRWFERNQSTLQLVEALRMSLRAGATVDQAIATACEMDVNERFRRRISKWLSCVQAGENISDAAIRCGIGSPVAWALDVRVNQGNTPMILETLETFYRTNYSYRANLVRFILWPCTTVAMGCVVGFVILAIFLPSVAFITYLVNFIVP